MACYVKSESAAPLKLPLVDLEAHAVYGFDFAFGSEEGGDAADDRAVAEERARLTDWVSRTVG
jgi:hypothetical protein